jgi:hypothetical protein
MLPLPVGEVGPVVSGVMWSSHPEGLTDLSQKYNVKVKVAAFSISKQALRNYHSDSGDCRNFYVNNLTAGAYTDNADNYTIGACGSTTWTTSPNRGFGPITGATGSTYTINPVATSDAGSYDVVVWNACGQATSSAATLLVSQSGNTVAQVGWTQDSGGPGGAPRAMKTMTSATGLSSAAAPTQTRCEVSATAYDAGNNVIGTIAPLPMASTDLPNGTVKVLFVATKTVHSTEPAYVRVVAKDACNNIGDSDPALTSLQVGNNGIVRQVIEHLHPAEHYLQVANGAPGLHRLELNVNGRSFQLPSLEDGKSLAADIGQAMVEGENNTVILTGHGEAGASAVILVTDRPVSDLVPLTELVVLKLTPAGSSLVLSWPETAVGWRLQASATGVGDWAEVSSVPVAADGQLSVPVQATSGVQFYRLAAPVGRVPINPPPATGATLVVPGSTQPQPTQDSHGAFIF